MTQSKILPSDLTSYDFLKMAAVILMIIDHFGAYFFPEELWFRVIGRACVPIWFFLIGYARSRDFGIKLWVGAFILLIANGISGMPLLPLNILFAMLIFRVALDPIMKFALSSFNALAATSLLLTLLSFFTFQIWEYGTLTMLLTMYGYMIRNKDKALAIHKDANEFFLIINIIIFWAVQGVMFGFSPEQNFVLAVLVFLSCGMLWFFKPQTYPALTANLPFFVTGFVQLMGRRTMEIYVLHLLVFKLVGMYLFPENYDFMNWRLFSG